MISFFSTVHPVVYKYSLSWKKHSGTLAEGLSIEKLFSGLANMCYTSIEFCYACNFLIGQANLSRFKYAKYTKDILWRPNVMDTEGKDKYHKGKS